MLLYTLCTWVSTTVTYYTHRKIRLNLWWFHVGPPSPVPRPPTNAPTHPCRPLPEQPPALSSRHVPWWRAPTCCWEGLGAGGARRGSAVSQKRLGHRVSQGHAGSRMG